MAKGIHTVVCPSPNCSVIFSMSDVTDYVARKKLREAGWVRMQMVGRKGWPWFCPSCAAKKAEG